MEGTQMCTNTDKEDHKVNSCIFCRKHITVTSCVQLLVTGEVQFVPGTIVCSKLWKLLDTFSATWFKSLSCHWNKKNCFHTKTCIYTCMYTKKQQRVNNRIVNY